MKKISTGTTEKKIIYVGNYEKITASSNTYEVHYIYAPSGMTAINVRQNGGAEKIYYIYTDHLGSIVKVTDGTTTYEQNYDAWGRERHADTWEYPTAANPLPAKPAWLIRGYTGHEHLPEFALINMNGRMYDPVLGRMLSPDNFVQDATGTQGYNRYSYAWNNPLVYADPTGNEITAWHLMAGAFFGALSWSPIYKQATGQITTGEAIGEYMVNAATFVIGGALSTANIYLTANIAITSTVNSLGMNAVYGGNTDITTSFGAASYNWNKGEWGYLGKSGNSIAEDIGYGLGAFANISDAYRFLTWDVLSAESKIAKLQKIYSDKKIKYDANLKGYANYNTETDEITFGERGLNKGIRWAKSTYRHEALHRTDNLKQPFIPENIASGDQYKAFREYRAWGLELNQASYRRLTYNQYNIIKNQVINQSKIAGVNYGTLPNYSFSDWLLSLFF